jgi:hypothetical protein
MPTFRLHIDGEKMDDFEAEDEKAARMFMVTIVAAEMASGRSTAIQVFSDDTEGKPAKRVALVRTDVPLVEKPKMSETLIKYLRDLKDNWDSTREYPATHEMDLIYAIDAAGGLNALRVDQVTCKEELDALAKTVGGLTEISDLID